MVRNPSTNIVIKDMPRRIRGGIGTIGSETSKLDTLNNFVISEVGEPVKIPLKSMEVAGYYYQLRRGRKYKVPGHVFGKMDLGEAFSAFIAVPFQVPAVGSSITLNPVVTTEQKKILDLFNFINADAFWIVHIPAPLGTGLLMRSWAPEIDQTTETRGVRWRPQVKQTIGFSCPWSSDVTMVPTNSGRPGQSGLSIKIQTIENNNIADMNDPLSGVAFCCVTNIHCSNLDDADDSPKTVLGLNFTPVLPPPEERVEHHMEGGELNADATNTAADFEAESSTANELAPVVETLAKPPTKPKKKTAAAKNQTGALNVIWINWLSVTFNSARVGEWINLTFDPNTFTNKGESMNLPWRRNVWTSGNNIKGYVTTIVTKWTIPRPPQISGLVEVVDSRNKSSRVFIMYGETKEVEFTPRSFSIVPARPVRYVNNPWLRTNESVTDARYKVVVHNRTGDIGDVVSRLTVRPGGSVFQAPTKPRARVAPTVLKWLIDSLEETLDVVHLHSDVDDTDDMDTLDTTNYIAPLAGDENEIGETNEEPGEEEFLDQEDFGVEVFRGNIPVGSPFTISFTLPSIVDASGDGVNNTITQKFERYAHIQPTKAGPFGPVIGSYTIKVRLPTQVAGDIAHVFLPADMNDETVVFALGLASILSLATTALQGVGGPLISGAMQLGKNLLGGVAKKILGGLAPQDTHTEQSNPVALGGEIGLSRFINFLKPILANETLDPTFGNLLVEARDFFGSLPGFSLETIPISVFARMNEHSVERTVWNRTEIPVATMKNKIYIPNDRIPYIAERFDAHPDLLVEGSVVNTNFRKFVKVLQSKFASQFTPLTLDEILEAEPVPYIAMQQMISSKTLIP